MINDDNFFNNKFNSFGNFTRKDAELFKKMSDKQKIKKIKELTVEGANCFDMIKKEISKQLRYADETRTKQIGIIQKGVEAMFDIVQNKMEGAIEKLQKKIDLDEGKSSSVKSKSSKKTDKKTTKKKNKKAVKKVVKKAAKKATKKTPKKK